MGAGLLELGASGGRLAARVDGVAPERLRQCCFRSDSAVPGGGSNKSDGVLGGEGAGDAGLSCAAETCLLSRRARACISCCSWREKAVSVREGFEGALS